MRCVLVSLGFVYNELDAVVCCVRCERGGRRPGVCPGVVDILRNVGYGNDIGTGALKKEERYSSGGCGLERVTVIEANKGGS